MSSESTTSQPPLIPLREQIKDGIIIGGGVCTVLFVIYEYFHLRGLNEEHKIFKGAVQKADTQFITLTKENADRFVAVTKENAAQAKENAAQAKENADRFVALTKENAAALEKVSNENTNRYVEQVKKYYDLLEKINDRK